jgi:uncharacterized tellurite resistance protein B-like protein
MLQEGISGFSDLDRQLYLKTLISVALADEVIHEKEKEFINAQAELLSVDPEPYWANPEKDISFLRNAVMSRLSRITTIRDCIVLGYIDGNFDDSERKQVAQIAEYLNLNASDVESVEDWLKEFWAILEKGKILFEGQ